MLFSFIKKFKFKGMTGKIIKGQAMIIGDSLVQNQTLISSSGVSENIVPLIKNIWEDLLKADGAHEYKSNLKKTYFYWEYKMTDSEDDTTEITRMIECPRPKEGLFEEPYDPANGKGDYAKVWLTRFKTAADNAKSSYTIQPKEIVFPGTKYINPQGDMVDVEEKRVCNDNLGDITNLLAIF